MTQYDQVQDIKRAILANLDYYQGVKLPSPQTSGTMTQRSTYAQLKAQEIQTKRFS